MNTFLCIAFVMSLAGSVAAPVGAVLFKSYQDERKRIEAGHEPTYLSYTTEEIYDPPPSRHPEVVESEEGESLGKTLALPVKTEAAIVASTEQSTIRKDIITKAAATTLSIVFTAPPGCGKTTTELAWLAKVFELYPDALVLITSQKNDSFLGLSEIPGVLTVLDGVDFQPLAEKVDRVFGILTERKNLPKSRRHEYQGQPVWLLLGDWFATCNTLANNKRYTELWNDIKTKIGLIITVGREFLVGIACDTHSFNTAALGIANDANIRDCLNIMALGKISRNQDGQEQGGYGAIAKAVGNKLVVDDDQIRSQLLKDLTQCAALSDQTGRPVLFTTMGHPPRMMLLPDLRRYETYKLPFDVLASVARQVGSSVADADTNIPLNQEPTDQQAWDRWVLEADEDTINDLIERKRNGSKPEPMNPPSEPLNQRSSNTPSGSGNGSPSRFTPLELTLNQVLRLIRELRSELNQTEIIERLWQVKKGGSEAWKKAHAEFKQLTEGENQ
jgi:hypothetical protein